MYRKELRHPYLRISARNKKRGGTSKGYTDGYRPNVGIIVANDDGDVLWGRRVKHDGWQFPQGGIEPRESVVDAAYRELYEEVGLKRKHVELLGRTHGWLRYDLPKIPQRGGHQIRGQKQAWVLFKLTTSDDKVRLNNCEKPEFDAWRWVDYWHPVNEIIHFKRQVYERALEQLHPLVEQYIIEPVKGDSAKLA